MKILIISPTQEGIGGVARHVQGLTKFLKSKGHTVDIISSENTFTLPIKKLKNPSFMISSFLKTSFKKNYDIIHAQNPAAALAMKNVSGKKILSIHGIHHEQVELLHGNTAGNIAKSYGERALTWADIITVSSKEMFEYYTQKGCRTYYLPNAIDISDLPDGTDRRYEKQVVYVARLSKEKGILNVLDIIKDLPADIHLIIVGSGVEEPTVKQTAKEYSNVHFLGYLENKKAIEIIRGSDILIQSSLMEGGISYTLLEAMACKIPLVCTDVGGGKDILQHMENAFLIKPNSPAELLNAIVDLMSDSDKRDKLATQAFKDVQKFDWSQVGLEYLKIYQELSNSK